MSTLPPTPKSASKPRSAKGATDHSPEPGTTDTSDTPPREERSGRGANAPRPGASVGRKPQLQKSLEELFAAPAMGYALIGDEWAASFVTERAPVLAEAWYKLSVESPAVRRILTRLTAGSAWGGVAVATGATVLPLLAHHDLLPVELPFDVGQDYDRPIVPPPPSADAPPSRNSPPRERAERRRRGGGTNDMTPPVKPGQPPGVVTVAGTNNGAN